MLAEYIYVDIEEAIKQSMFIDSLNKQLNNFRDRYYSILTCNKGGSFTCNLMVQPYEREDNHYRGK